MIRVLGAGERFRTEIGWLDSRHTFSFGDHYDPGRMGFRTLRVVNEDRVLPAKGFGTHGHRDMEIVSWVIEGALAHEDSTGHSGVIRPGDVQRMTAGTGVRHSEWNDSKTEPVHFLQIWILPERAGIAPGYEQKAIGTDEGLRLVASRDGRSGSVTIHQDAEIHVARLRANTGARHAIRSGRGAFVQLVRGALDLNGRTLRPGDGAEVEGETDLVLAARDDAEALVFDLA